MIKNYRIRDAEGLSFKFLTVWLAGDVANFIGCIITGQLPFQIYLSIYFIIIDTILCIQWLYYVKYRYNFIRVWIDGENDEIKTNHKITNDTTISSSNSKNIIHPKEVNEQSSLLSTTPQQQKKKYITMMMFFFMVFNNNANTVMTTTSTTAVDILNEDNTIWVGRFFAWICTFLYLSSRLPQIYQNFCRRSVEGLSMFLFFFAAMGNLTYVLGIFTNPHATRATLLEAIPYIIGSAGTLIFDATIFLQYRLYTKKTSHVELTTSVI